MLIFIKKLFGHFPKRWPDMNHREREKTGDIRSNQKTFVCLENMTKKFETPLHNLMGNKKKMG